MFPLPPPVLWKMALPGKTLRVAGDEVWDMPSQGVVTMN